jgi:hypothetical protein
VPGSLWSLSRSSWGRAVADLLAFPGAEPPSEEEVLQDLITKLDRAALMGSASPDRVLRTLYGQASAALKLLHARVPQGTERVITEYSYRYDRKRLVTHITGEWEDCTPEERERGQKLWDDYDEF